MKRLLLNLVLLTIAVCANAQENDINVLYSKLDSDIANTEVFEERHEASIAKTRNLLKRSHSDEERFKYSFNMYEHYVAFQNDSAMTYLRRSCEIAARMKRHDLEGKCLSLLAFQCSTVGFYNEALAILSQVDRTSLNKDALAEYYLAYNHVYGELGYYSVLTELSREYYAKSDIYRDSIFQVTDKNSPKYLLQEEKLYYNKQDLKMALQTNDKWMSMVKMGSHDFAIVSFYRYLIYSKQGNMNEAKIWLAKSAICDIENAVMDQASLIELANIISNEDNNVTRAYNYISYSWRVAEKFGTKVRSSQISPILRVIDNKYQEKINSSNKRLFVYTILMTLLALLSFVLFYYANKQRQRLTKAQDNLHDINIELKTLNGQLSEANNELDKRNQQLANTNADLSISNKKLFESNSVKEEYIGRFLSLCSLYVDKLETMRKRVNKMVKNKQLDELYEMTRYTDLNVKELNELYTNFDEAFLHLFPNFINDFNALLQPQERIQLTDNKHLPITMRIFALIRLGIEDSSKIAILLHYSVNTIYNYRARVKNGALINRDDFEKHVKAIGMSNDYSNSLKL